MTDVSVGYIYTGAGYRSSKTVWPKIRGSGGRVEEKKKWRTLRQDEREFEQIQCSGVSFGGWGEKGGEWMGVEKWRGPRKREIVFLVGDGGEYFFFMLDDLAVRSRG